MATLGYVFPKKNKDQLLSEIAQSVKNYKNDVLQQTFQRKPVMIQQSIVPQILQSIQPVPGINPDAVTPKSVPNTPTRVTRNLNAVVSELINNPKFKSRQVSEASSPVSSGLPSPVNSPKSGYVSPTPTELTIASSQKMGEFADQFELAKTARGEQRDKYFESVYDFLVDEVNKGSMIYAATGPAASKKHDENLLVLNENGKLVTKGINGKGSTPLDMRYLGITFKINLPEAVLGSGLKAKNYRAGLANLGKFFINLESLRRGNLSIYRPKSNVMYLNKKSISPKLVQLIREIKQDKKFDINDYESLKESEKIIADKVINLAQVDYPVKMKRALDETIWNLKQRYEILLGSYNAGNDGKLVTDEIKSVLKELLKHKAISKTKHDYILKAI